MADARGGRQQAAGDGVSQIDKDLARIARMFGDYRDDRLMRELCRLAVKCAQERLISV